MDNQEDGRVVPTGLSQAEPEDSLGPTGFDPSRVEHCSFADIGTPAPDSPPELLATLDTYLSAFAKPIKTDRGLLCLNCDKPLTGLMAMFYGGGFEWGLAHGEGHCAGCRWPARAHHFVKCADGSPLTTIRNLILQYHPDYVEGHRDSDGSPKGGDACGSVHDSAGPQDIAQPNVGGAHVGN